MNAPLDPRPDLIKAGCIFLLALPVLAILAFYVYGEVFGRVECFPTDGGAICARYVPIRGEVQYWVEERSAP